MNSYITPLILSALTSPLSANNLVDSTYSPKIEYKRIKTSTCLYNCTVEDYHLIGQDPVTKINRTLKFSLYKARRPLKGSPSVILLPPTGGVNILDQGYANELCSSNITTLLISGWDHQNDSSLDFNMHNLGALRFLSAVRHSVEFLEQQNSKSIGLMGTSIGAIGGLLSFGVESRIKAGAFIVGSARFADVVAESDEAGAAALRKARMKHFNLKTQEEYTNAVRSHVHFEPADFLKQNDERNTLIVTADEDTTVASKHQNELAEILSPDVHLELKGDHRKVIKDTFLWKRSAITSFFQKSLGVNDEAE